MGKFSRTAAGGGSGGGGGRQQRAEAPFAAEDETYVRIVAVRGNCRFGGVDAAGNAVDLKIKGSLRKRPWAWVNVNCICLASKRPQLGDTMDIVWVYNAAEVKMLRRYGAIDAKLDCTTATTTHDDGNNGNGDEFVVFEDDDDGDDVDAI